MSMAEPAHSPFGGSVAARILRCPASVGLVEKVPAYVRKVSAYAERGTALHAAMTLLIERARSPEDLIGETIEGYRITADDVENALRPALAYAEALLDEPDAEYYLEQRVVFPTVPGALGTVDLIIRISGTLYIVDFKFGVGVRVLALYPDGDEDVINAQLLFYATAARHSLPDFFAGVDEVVLTILQPMSIEADAEMASSVTVTPAELDAFITVYRAACETALAPAPALAAGRLVSLLFRAANLPGAYGSAVGPRAVRGADAAVVRRCRFCPAGCETNLPAGACRRLEPHRRGQGHAHGASRSGEARAGERRPRARLRAFGRAGRTALV
jgi:hypothetical protein